MSVLFEPDVNRLLVWAVPRSTLNGREWEVLNVLLGVVRWEDTPPWIVDAIRDVPPPRPPNTGHLLA